MKKILLSLFLFISLVPNLTFAADVVLDYSGLVKCDGILSRQRDPKTGVEGGFLPGEEKRDRICDFAALMDTIKSGINWLFVISIPIMVALTAYGGLLYMTGSQKYIGQAKAIFFSAGKGFIIMLIAWISVVTVVNWFISEANKAVINTFVNTSK